MKDLKVYDSVCTDAYCGTVIICVILCMFTLLLFVSDSYVPNMLVEVYLYLHVVLHVLL